MARLRHGAALSTAAFTFLVAALVRDGAPHTLDADARQWAGGTSFSRAAAAAPVVIFAPDRVPNDVVIGLDGGLGDAVRGALIAAVSLAAPLLVLPAREATAAFAAYARRAARGARSGGDDEE
eukprot:gene51735-24977_t